MVMVLKCLKSVFESGEHKTCNHHHHHHHLLHPSSSASCHPLFPKWSFHKRTLSQRSGLDLRWRMLCRSKPPRSNTSKPGRGQGFPLFNWLTVTLVRLMMKVVILKHDSKLLEKISTVHCGSLLGSLLQYFEIKPLGYQHTDTSKIMCWSQILVAIILQFTRRLKGVAVHEAH